MAIDPVLCDHNPHHAMVPLELDYGNGIKETTFHCNSCGRLFSWTNGYFEIKNDERQNLPTPLDRQCSRDEIKLMITTREGKPTWVCPKNGCPTQRTYGSIGQLSLIEDVSDNDNNRNYECYYTVIGPDGKKVADVQWNPKNTLWQVFINGIEEESQHSDPEAAVVSISKSNLTVATI